MDHPIRSQIASLEAQVLSLRDSLATLPPKQRNVAGAGLERVLAALAELRVAVTTMPPNGSGETGRLRQNDDELIWTTERTTRLYAINTALSVALTQPQAAHVVIDQALPALLADGGVVMLSSNDESLKIIDETRTGGPAANGPLPLDELSPFGLAARTAQSIWIESPDEVRRRFPSWRDSPWSLAGSIAAMPLIAEGRVLGVMAFRFDRARPFTIADRAFMLVLAQQCASAFERVHLYEQVRRAAAHEERSRLARDLHDSVSQALYAIVLSVSVGRTNLTRDLARVARALDNIESLTGLAQADLRALLFDLRADSVARTGLVNALQERAQFIRHRHGFDVQTELCDEPTLGPLCKDALYGIAREALHNAAKHARASRIVLKLESTAEGLVLEVSDDGTGFDPAELRPGHYGMQSMRERAAELGAEFRVESARGQGTRVIAVVPTPVNSIGGQDAPACVEQDTR